MKAIEKSIKDSAKHMTGTLRLFSIHLISIIILTTLIITVIAAVATSIPEISDKIGDDLLGPAVFSIIALIPLIIATDIIYLSAKNNKKNIEKVAIIKFAVTFSIITLTILLPTIILPIQSFLDFSDKYEDNIWPEPLTESMITQSLLRGMANPILLACILTWFLLFYTPFIILIENKGISESAKKSIHIATKHPKQVAIAIITSYILFMAPLAIASIPFLLITSPAIILIPELFAMPLSLLLIIPGMIISAKISFSFISHYYINALQDI